MMHSECQIFSLFSQQQIQEVFKNQQEQLNIQLMQQKNAGMVNQEVGPTQKNNTLAFYLNQLIFTVVPKTLLKE